MHKYPLSEHLLRLLEQALWDQYQPHLLEVRMEIGVSHQ